MKQEWQNIDSHLNRVGVTYYAVHFTFVWLKIFHIKT